MKTIELTKKELNHLKSEMYSQALFINVEKKKHGYITKYDQELLNNCDSIYIKLNDNKNRIRLIKYS